MYAQGFLFSYRHSVIRHSQRPFPLAKIIKKQGFARKTAFFSSEMRFGPKRVAFWANSACDLGQNTERFGPKRNDSLP
jgi:hypothetical protein